ncbi:MAG TPA: hypothetical protein VFL79_15115 [Terriglobia bacterium]|nr:hypothetical protein [Terriglobia bacterium]
MLAGDLVKRRRLDSLPGYSSSKKKSRLNIVFLKDAMPKDEMDNWRWQSTQDLPLRGIT